jgi:DNA replication protein DnaC
MKVINDFSNSYKVLTYPNHLPRSSSSRSQQDVRFPALSFEERFSLWLDRELTLHENRRLNRLLQLARLRQSACVEDIDYSHRRSLERSLMAALITCDWIRAHHNLHLTGPTGTGKSWLACALGQQSLPPGTLGAL